MKHYIFHYSKLFKNALKFLDERNYKNKMIIIPKRKFILQS